LEKAYSDNLSEENHENLRSLEGGHVHWHMKKALLVILPDENHEILRALERGCLHWHFEKAHIDNPS
jgi:hypothetical protein